MFPHHKHKLGVGCAVCNHIWFILTNDDEIDERIQIQWAQGIVAEHDAIHKEQGYNNDEFQE